MSQRRGSVHPDSRRAPLMRLPFTTTARPHARKKVVAPDGARRRDVAARPVVLRAGVPQQAADSSEAPAVRAPGTRRARVRSGGSAVVQPEVNVPFGRPRCRCRFATTPCQGKSPALESTEGWEPVAQRADDCRYQGRAPLRTRGLNLYTTCFSSDVCFALHPRLTQGEGTVHES